MSLRLLVQTTLHLPVSYLVRYISVSSSPAVCLTSYYVSSYCLPLAADNDDVRNLMDRMATANDKIESLRKEINKLEDDQNALPWFNMSYWFGGNSTRINSKE